MRLVRHTLAVALWAAGCCSCALSAAELQMRDLNGAVQEMQAQLTRYDNKVEDLSNRVFLLSDRVDQLKVELSRGPTPTPLLQVVKLEPGVEPEIEEEELRESLMQITMTGSSGPAPLSVAEVPPPPADVAAKPQDAERLFRGALEAYRGGNPARAHEQFGRFVRRYPNHDYADNAVYWMGECRFEQAKYKRAIGEFSQVMRRYPHSNKAPDALLKMGLAYERLGKSNKARAWFHRVITGYPKSAIAELAKARLVARGARAERNR